VSVIHVRPLVLAAFVAVAIPSLALAQTEAAETYTPTPGMAGKDSVWVPTSPELIEKMLDMAGVTPNDVVVDLGSGDGRMVIAAANRGARARGVEFNADLVAYSERAAAEQGVGDKATFVQGDMFAADISDATVLPLFLMPENLRRLTPTFLRLAPGSRIVVNTLGIPEWQPDRVERLESCTSWCEAKLYIVPAQVAGQWELPDGSLEVEQTFQHITGTLVNGGAPLPIEDGVVQGNDVTFTAGGERYTGRVNGQTINWTMASGPDEHRFTARRAGN
jgi:precorrin-6B methylase 2